MSTHQGMWQRDVIPATTQRRRTGKVDQHPATAAALADGRSPHDRLPVAATSQVRGAGRVTVAAAGPRRIAIAVLALVVLGMAAYAATRVAASVQTIASAGLPGWLWPFLAGGLLVGRIAFRAGQYHRGFFHAKGIWRSHRASINGRGH